MIRLIRFIFTGDWHRHEWEAVSRFDLWGDSDTYPENTILLCRCKHCGKIRKTKI